MKDQSPARFPFYGWLGALIVIGAETGLILRQLFISRWFTPIVWTGYILFADALAFRLRGRSLIRSEPRQALMLPWLSAGCWMIFELYNLRLGNWYYVGVPENPWVRNLAYLWSFATIFPGIFETADVLDGLGLFRRARVSPRPMTPFGTALSFLLGIAFLTIPPFCPHRPVPLLSRLSGRASSSSWNRSIGNWGRPPATGRGRKGIPAPRCSCWQRAASADCSGNSGTTGLLPGGAIPSPGRWTSRSTTSGCPFWVCWASRRLLWSVMRCTIFADECWAGTNSGNLKESPCPIWNRRFWSSRKCWTG